MNVLSDLANELTDENLEINFLSDLANELTNEKLEMNFLSNLADELTDEVCNWLSPGLQWVWLALSCKRFYHQINFNDLLVDHYYLIPQKRLISNPRKLYFDRSLGIVSCFTIKYQCFKHEILTPEPYRGHEHINVLTSLDKIATKAIKYNPLVTIPNTNHNIIFGVHGNIDSGEVYVLVKTGQDPNDHYGYVRVPHHVIGVSTNKEWLLDDFERNEFDVIELGIMMSWENSPLHPTDNELLDDGYIVPVTSKSYRAYLNKNGFLIDNWYEPNNVYYLIKVTLMKQKEGWGDVYTKK